MNEDRKTYRENPLSRSMCGWEDINPLNSELNHICQLLALFGAHHILHISRVRVKIHLQQAGEDRRNGGSL
jgi:hypothetical protein